MYEHADTFNKFVKERIFHQKGSRVFVSVLYAEFLRWVQKNTDGAMVQGTSAFIHYLRNAGIVVHVPLNESKSLDVEKATAHDVNMVGSTSHKITSVPAVAPEPKNVIRLGSKETTRADRVEMAVALVNHFEVKGERNPAASLFEAVTGKGRVVDSIVFSPNSMSACTHCLLVPGSYFKNSAPIENYVKKAFDDGDYKLDLACIRVDFEQDGSDLKVGRFCFSDPFGFEKSKTDPHLKVDVSGYIKLLYPLMLEKITSGVIEKMKGAKSEKEEKKQ